MSASTLSLMPLLAFALPLAIAAIEDFRRFIIPNWTCATLAAFGLACLLASPLEWSAIGGHVSVGLAAFALGFGLFAVGFWGGGDGKLFAATALWFDWATILHFVSYMLIAGAALGVAAILLMRFSYLLKMAPFLSGVDFEHRKRTAPFGVAIAAGALLAFPGTELFQAYAGL